MHCVTDGGKVRGGNSPVLVVLIVYMGHAGQRGEECSIVACAVLLIEGK